MIEFRIGDWRTNVSLMGLMNILDYSHKKYTLSDDKKSLLISKQVLEGFEKDYFEYFIGNYEEFLPWHRIVSYRRKLSGYLDNLSCLDENDLEDINGQIDLVKYYMSRPNYTKIYKFIDERTDIEEKVKGLQKVSLRQNEKAQDKINDIRKKLNTLGQIIEYSDTYKARSYMGAKGAIYTYINRGIEGVSFLNRQTSEKDIYADYKNYFINPFKDYLRQDKEKYKYNCFSCGGEIKNLNTNMNLVKDTGFDRIRKSSHIWNHESDFAICKKCLFLYSCLSAGFCYFLSEGIFVDYNFNLKAMKKMNRNLKKNIIAESNRPENAISYRTLVNTINRQYQRHIKFEMGNIRIVRYKNNSYRFNLLSKKSLKIIRDSRKNLGSIEKAGYREGAFSFSIYDLVLDRIFSNQNLFTLIHYLIVNLISANPGFQRYYNEFHISCVLKINSRIIEEGILVMDGEKVGKLTDISRASGYYLRKAYDEFMADKKRVENRMKSLTYKMTNALKTNNPSSFMDTLINAYAYIGQPIPMNLVEALKGSNKLRIVGYAFVTGINSFNKKGDNYEE